MINKTGYYIRVSTDDQKEGLELYRQRAAQFCNQYNHQLIEIYSDDDVSGKIELFKRPEGKRMYNDLISGKINTIASPDMSRLFRDLRDGVNTLHDLETMKVKVFASNLYGDAFDLTSLRGFSMIIDELKEAQIERMRVSQRTTDAMAYRRRNSMATSHEPYGYIKETITIKNRTVHQLNECPNEMKVVHGIIKLKEKGYSLKDIANVLKESKVPTKKGGKWHPVTVQKIISYQLAKNDVGRLS
jgi:site-specific DNA recombinase